MKKQERQRYQTVRGWISFLKETRRRKAYLKFRHVRNSGTIQKESTHHLKEKTVIKSQLDLLSSRSRVMKVPKSRKGSIKLKLPHSFCLFSNPEKSLQFIASVCTTLDNLKYNEIDFDHRKIKNSSLGAEVLLGNIVKHLAELRDNTDKPIHIIGSMPTNEEHAALISEIGIVRDLAAEVHGITTKNTQKIHLFSKECVLGESTTSSSTDHKNNASLEFVSHISRCLRDHKLRLKQDYKNHFKSALAEILDNAEEHSALTAPKWFVKGYLNNNCQNKMLELVIFNYGSTIYENFMALDESSYTRKKVDSYVQRHKNIVDEEVLYNIMALQVRVSTKNFSEKDTRGHGTMKLLKLFRSFYDSFANLRTSSQDRDEHRKPEMSIISGNSFIMFDGKYHLKQLAGEERKLPILTFNDSVDGMQSPPDTKYVKKMKGAFFPGVIINFRVPLIGTIEGE